jgi:hypothetical protein
MRAPSSTPACAAVGELTLEACQAIVDEVAEELAAIFNVSLR